MISIKSIYGHLPYHVRSQIHVFRYKSRYQNARHSEQEHLFKLFDCYKCIFVHIPKTGGVSVYRSLFSKEPKNFVKSIGHFSVRDYEIIFGKDTVQEYFKFAFVRNPWSRAVSSYQFMKKGGFHAKDSDWAKANLSRFSSFNEFVMEWLNPRNAYRALHFIPQHEFLKSSDGRIKIDFIGKLECIENDFNQVKSKLKIDCQLEHFNKSNAIPDGKTDYRDQYTDATRRIVAEVYRKDIEIFNYTF